jgi:DNA adenine methylase
LGDVNSELINAFRETRRHPDAIWRSLSRYNTGPDAYYRIRSLNPRSLSKVQRAARFIYLNRYCFNGIYRTNMQGVFNVPYGGGRTGPLPSLQLLRACSRAMASVSILQADFEVLLEQARIVTVYRPPYTS